MFRDFTWRFWVIGIVAVLIIGIPIVTGTGVHLGLDLQGGTMLTYRLVTEDQQQFDTVLKVLQKRLDILGMRQLVLRKEGPNDFVVQVPGVDAAEIDKIKHLIRTSGILWFKIVAGRQDDLVTVERILALKEEDQYDPDEEYDIALRRDEETGKLFPKEDPASYTILENKGAVAGRLLSRSFPTQDQFGSPAVGFRFGPEGAKLFGELTEDNVGRQLAIVLDGVLHSSPAIKSRIGAHGIIEGRFTQEEVSRTVIVLQGGSLPSKPIPESDLTVGPGLGRDSIERGKLATWISLGLVIAFMLVYYRGPGVVASFALLFNLALLVCILIDFEATLTLPGIAGIVLTVGMAIDANILIFERIREEKTKGMGLRQAIENGYGRAFWTIFDANLTTLITALILFQVGTGPIKGFAVTLSIGILTSLFSALFVTKTIFALLVVKGWVTKFHMLTLIRQPSIPFQRYQRKGMVISSLLIVAGMSVFVARGQEKYGIEFTGGVLFQVKFREAMHVSEVREMLQAIGPEFADAEVQAVTFEKEEKGAGEAPEDGGEEKEVEGALPGRESHEFQIRIRTVTEDLDPAEVRAELEGALAGKVEPATLEGALDIAFEGRIGLAAGRSVLADALADAIDPGVLAPILEKAYQGVVDPSKFKPQIDEAFAEILAPVPFADLPSREAVQMDPDEPGWGKISVVVRLDPRIRELPDPEKLKAALDLAGFPDCVVEPGPEDETGVVSLKVTTGLINMGSEGAGEHRKALTKFFKDSVEYPVSEPYPRVIDIGQSVAYNLKSKAILAMVFAVFAIILYITFRFEFKFGLAAIVALVHDVLFALGVVASVDALGLFDVKIDLAMVTAFLTIIGYSLNDTIVVFDRIRESLGGRKKMEYEDLVNKSINQTLSRTLLTSVTTFVALLALFLAGVNVIRDFSFAMIIGVVVGTYSSIFIASPVLVYLRNREVRAEEAAARQSAKT